VTTSDVLIVEDEPDIAELIRFHTEREGCRAQVVHSGRIALDAIRRRPPAVVVLDLMLPDLDGLELCRRLKWDELTRQIPILIVSARGEESDVVAGLELGAEDYVTKPFSPKVLMARMRNILRRQQTPRDSQGEQRRLSLIGGRLIVDDDRHQVVVDGSPVELTRTEFAIVRCLARRPGFVRTRDQLIAAIHGDHAVLTSRTIDVHVTAIRRKLGPLGDLLQTVRGVGYRLQEAADEAEG
jgi:two-component system phosphate regulon response regulator PhoB